MRNSVGSSSNFTIMPTKLSIMLHYDFRGFWLPVSIRSFDHIEISRSALISDQCIPKFSASPKWFRRIWERFWFSHKSPNAKAGQSYAKRRLVLTLMEIAMMFLFIFEFWKSARMLLAKINSNSAWKQIKSCPNVKMLIKISNAFRGIFWSFLLFIRTPGIVDKHGLV